MTTLSPAGVRIRALVAALIIASILWGSFAGVDDNFPIGPFSMFAGSDSPNGRVKVPFVEGRTPTEGWHQVYFPEFGLRRAEIEGQLGRIARPPHALLARLAEAYRRMHPEAEPLTALRLMYKTYRLENGRPAKIVITETAEWEVG